MINQSARPILEVLDKLQVFNPVKIVFNNFEFYNDYDSTEEIEPGVYGELLPPMSVVPERLKTALDSYDVYVNKLDIRIVHHHHSIVYLYGKKVLRKKDA